MSCLAEAQLENENIIFAGYDVSIELRGKLHLGGR